MSEETKGRIPFIKKGNWKTARRTYMNVFLVFLSYLLMILSTEFFMSRTLNNRLLQNVDDGINGVQKIISNALLRPELPMNYMSKHIQDMLRRGESFELIKAYMAECSSPAYKERMVNFPFFSIYGYFYDYDVYYNGGGWVPDNNFIPKERPWYKAAIEGKGKVAIAPPYIELRSNLETISYSRLLTSQEGQPLAVVSMNVPLSFIGDFITGRQITKNGYGWLMDENMVFVIHPNENYINVPMREISRYAGVVDELQQNLAVSMYEFKSYKEEDAIIFSRRLDNGWYVGFVIPKADYFKDMNIMIWVISALGFFLAALLCVTLISIDKAIL
jgi:hypothetical protein